MSTQIEDSIELKSCFFKNAIIRLLLAVASILSVTATFAQEVDSHWLEQVAPEDVGLDSVRLDQIDGLVQAGIAEGKMPGSVVAIGRHGKLAFLRAFGNKQLQPTPVPMTIDTLFDMASITKPVATATSIMSLVEQGRIRLGDRIVEYFPEFASNGKDLITVQDLLVHQSGLIPDNPVSDYAQGKAFAWKQICDLKLTAPVGETFKYSDVNFIVLGELVQKITGQDIHEYSQAAIFEPLSMLETGFRPSESLKLRAAPTEQRDGTWIQGTVHDPRAFLMDGVAGHAGLFSTARDLAIYAQMMLGRGSLQKSVAAGVGRANGGVVRILSPPTVDLMTRGVRVSSGLRGLGWDKRTSYSSNRGDLLSSAAFGHGGFTGTVLWLDPELDLFFIFLSNRVHPDGKGSVNSLAGKLLNVVVSAIEDPIADDSAIGDLERKDVGSQNERSPTLLGLDVLLRDDFRQLAGLRVGLITNHTGRSSSGMSTAALLHRAANVKLVALFSPEHGFEGALDTERISDATDTGTGLKIHSLYGETRRPTAAMLAGVDAIVFDIQDIGTRFYTYISTMGEAMQAASEHGKKFIVLDRPNPINGIDVAGPMLDPGRETFVAFHNVPVRHGMTIGELAMLLRAELNLQLDLEVIACEGWRRTDFWDDTGLLWINPSPNMRSLTQALLYPGIGLLETTNVSVGRGTDTPFEVVGAPWIEGRKLARALNAMPAKGVCFVPVEFTPKSSKFENEKCGGVNIVITDRQHFEPLSVGFSLARALREIYADDWKTDSYLRLLGHEATHTAVVGAKTMVEIRDAASLGVGDFMRRREKYLIYE